MSDDGAMAMQPSVWTDGLDAALPEGGVEVASNDTLSAALKVLYLPSASRAERLQGLTAGQDSLFPTKL